MRGRNKFHHRLWKTDFPVPPHSSLCTCQRIPSVSNQYFSGFALIFLKMENKSVFWGWFMGFDGGLVVYSRCVMHYAFGENQFHKLFSGFFVVGSRISRSLEKLRSYYAHGRRDKEKKQQRNDFNRQSSRSCSVCALYRLCLGHGRSLQGVIHLKHRQHEPSGRRAGGSEWG